MPPAVSSLLSTPSRSQSVLLGREPPTDRENDPRAATSLSLPEVKKLPGLVSEVAPAVRVASCTKSRPFNGSCATSCEVMTWPREGLAVSTAMASPGDRYRGDDGCGHEREIQFAGFIDLEMQVLRFGAAKTRGIDAHGVDPDRQQRDQIMSGAVGLRVSSEAGPWEVATTVAPGTRIRICRGYFRRNFRSPGRAGLAP